MTTSKQRNGQHGTQPSDLDAAYPGARSGLALVVAGTSTVLDELCGLLHGLGYQAVTATSISAALTTLEHARCVFTLLDRDVADDEGADALRRLRARALESGPLVLLSEEREMTSPVEMVSLGIGDVIRKPVSQADLDSAVKNALLRSRRSGVTAADDAGNRLEEELALWCSPRMQDVRRTITLIAGADITVLVVGETGTGKDVVARSIHHLSARRTRSFIKVNCAALPRDLLESELFGHERGAFTGAHELKIGKFELANHGTIFLDEIGDLHPDLQGKLLHVLQDGQFSRVGGRSTIKVDVRVLAATNQDLERNVGAGSFREDLFYRLNVIQIAVPPLRDRVDEIPGLAQYFVDRYAQLFQREPFTLAPDTVRRLQQHRYAGNVRELENIIKRMIVLDDPFLVKSGFVSPPPDDVPAAPARLPSVSLKEIGRRAAQDAERAAILQMLERTRWNRLRAAKQLNISYRALLYKMKEAGIGLDRSGEQRP